MFAAVKLLGFGVLSSNGLADSLFNSILFTQELGVAIFMFIKYMFIKLPIRCHALQRCNTGLITPERDKQSTYGMSFRGLLDPKKISYKNLLVTTSL